MLLMEVPCLKLNCCNRRLLYVGRFTFNLESHADQSGKEQNTRWGGGKAASADKLRYWKLHSFKYGLHLDSDR